MNEQKIKQLATEVGISVEYLTNTKQWVLIEALAERIVKECVDIANDTKYDGRVVANRIQFVFGIDTIGPENMRARCEALVIAMVGKNLSEQWWTSPNKAFCGDTPEMIYSVAPSAVYAYLMKSAEGEW